MLPFWLFWDSHKTLNLVVNGMSKSPPNLVDLPPEVQAFVAAQAAELARKDAEMLDLSLRHATAQQRLKDEMASVDAALSAERSAHARAIQNRDTIIADLRLQLHGHKKHRFGSKSESGAQLALELILEEFEIEQAAEADDEPSDAEAKPPRTSRTRKPFPKGLKWVQKTITPSGLWRQLQSVGNGCDGGVGVCPGPLHHEPNWPPASGLHLL